LHPGTCCLDVAAICAVVGEVSANCWTMIAAQMKVVQIARQKSCRPLRADGAGACTQPARFRQLAGPNLLLIF